MMATSEVQVSSAGMVATQPVETLQSESISSPLNLAPKKLHGRAFYESIGSPKFVLAPMVDQSEFAWRLLSRSFMAPASSKDLVAYTPMLHARMFCETAKFREHHFQPLRSPLTSHPDISTPISPSSVFLDGNPAIDRPLFTQFCANDPDELLKAAKYVAPYCDAVDLNLGCPQGIARKGKYGAFLQEDQELIFSLINKLHLELDVPVTAKIRILETKEKTLDYARNVLRAGASILTVHGRQRDQKGHKTGLADWKMIRYLRDQLPKETVLFANGNILRKADIDRCIEETGADGVMSAEGNLYDPSIFSDAPEVGQEGREYWRGRDGKGGWRMDATLRRYMDILYKYVLEVSVPKRAPLYLPSDPIESGVVAGEDGTATEDGGPPKKRQKTEKKEKTTSPNLLAMQPHLFKLLRPLVAKHHNIRDALAKCRAGDIAAFENVLQMVEVVVAAGLKEYEDTEGRSWEEELANDEKLRESKKKESTTMETVPDKKAQASPSHIDEDIRTVVEGLKPRMIKSLEGKTEDPVAVVRAAADRILGAASGGSTARDHNEDLVYSLMAKTLSAIPDINFQLPHQLSLESVPTASPSRVENITDPAENNLYESSVETVKACKRPWWIVQPYVRPLPVEALAKGSLTLSKKERAKLEKQEVVKPRQSTHVDGHTEIERMDNGTETAEIPKDGLVCG